MATLSHNCPLICLGSFSKILAPGLRLGWMQGRPDLIKKMTKSGLLTSGGGLNPFTSEIVNAVIGLGFLKDNIQYLKTVYRQRIKTFCDQLHRHLPCQAVFKIPKGGYFVWVQLAEGIDTNTFRPAAQQQNVDFFPEICFHARKDWKTTCAFPFPFMMTSCWQKVPDVLVKWWQIISKNPVFVCYDQKIQSNVYIAGLAYKKL